jgi:hypothetical protein
MVEREGVKREERREEQPRIWEFVRRSVELEICRSAAPRVVVIGVNIVWFGMESFFRIYRLYLSGWGI